LHAQPSGSDATHQLLLKPVLLLMTSDVANPADLDAKADENPASSPAESQPALNEKTEGTGAEKSPETVAVSSEQPAEDLSPADKEDGKPKLAMLPPPIRRARPPVPAFSSQAKAADPSSPPGEGAKRSEEGRIHPLAEHSALFRACREAVQYPSINASSATNFVFPVIDVAVGDGRAVGPKTWDTHNSCLVFCGQLDQHTCALACHSGMSLIGPYSLEQTPYES
jgi:hypothetical protein